MTLTISLAALALLSLALMLWQFVVALRFPLHRRVSDTAYTPAVTLLKPVKGADAETWHCLESWFTQDYPGPVQILFGVASAEDPACNLVRQLIAAHPQHEAQLLLCAEALGGNAKVSTLIQLHRQTRHDVVIVSDADVRVPPDFLVNVVAPLRDPAVGLVNCFYRLANPATLAMEWEAIAVNADFWSQVLQSASLKSIEFALGAVMATPRQRLDAFGGFDALVDYLADDYQLGKRIAGAGGRVVLSTVVVECWEPPKPWNEVWRHQLRWARTIRVCQPLPYFFSVLNNVTIWPLTCAVSSSLQWAGHVGSSVRIANPTATIPGSEAAVEWTLFLLVFCLGTRVLSAGWLQARLNRSSRHWIYCWLVPLKDLLNFLIWLLAVLGNTVEWRGQRYRLRRGGKLDKGKSAES